MLLVPEHCLVWQTREDTLCVKTIKFLYDAIRLYHSTRKLEVGALHINIECVCAYVWKVDKWRHELKPTNHVDMMSFSKIKTNAQWRRVFKVAVYFMFCYCIGCGFSSIWKINVVFSYVGTVDWKQIKDFSILGGMISKSGQDYVGLTQRNLRLWISLTIFSYVKTIFHHATTKWSFHPWKGFRGWRKKLYQNQLVSLFDCILVQKNIFFIKTKHSRVALTLLDTYLGSDLVKK